MSIELNRHKNIGRVLFIVEGEKTESFVLWKVFSEVFNYQLESKLRNRPYRVYNQQNNPFSKVFVINTQDSNIKSIARDNEYLNNLFKILIEDYDFDVDNAAIFYLFDRDPKSNTDPGFIKDLLYKLENSRENENYYRQGLLLLSYPSVESFTLSCFYKNCFSVKVQLGDDLKRYLDEHRLNQSRINEDAIEMAASVLCDALRQINGGKMFDVDNFRDCNLKVFHFEENSYSTDDAFRCLSLLCVALIDLGLIEINND